MSVAAALPASAIVINRPIGAGLSAGETAESVRQMVAVYEDADVERFFVQLHPAARPGKPSDWHFPARLEKTRGWQKFRRGREPVPDVETGPRIERIGPEHGNAFGRVGRTREPNAAAK